ncbi:unnamed protein product, partial [Allacma fusca]
LPYFASLPHFLHADSTYTQNASGLSANDDLHQTHFIIEPVTGSVLESSLKFQLNVNLTKFEDEKYMWDDVAIQDTVFPLFWTEKKFSIAAENVEEIRRYLEEMTAGTTTITPTTTALIRTTPTRVIDTTTSSTPISNPVFEAIKHQINDISRNINKFSDALLAIVVII